MVAILRNLIAGVSPNSGLAQLFPPNSKFIPERDIVDPTNQSIMITGFNSGIGFGTTLQLARRNAGKLYLAARSEAKAKQAIEDLRKQAPGTTSELIFVQVDLSDLKSVKKAADRLLEQEVKIDVLYNNAGVAASPNADVTAQGYDMQWGTNVLGSYYLTKLLQPALIAAADASGKPSRIINTSSALHQNTVPGKTGIDFKTFKQGPERDEVVKGMAVSPLGGLYGQSKLGNIFISDEFSKWNPSKIVSCSLHPGLIRSNLMSHQETSLFSKFLNAIASDVEYGAMTQLYAGNGPNSNINGKYYIPWAREGAVSKQAQNKETQAAVIKWLEEAIRAL